MRKTNFYKSINYELPKGIYLTNVQLKFDKILSTWNTKSNRKPKH